MVRPPQENVIKTSGRRQYSIGQLLVEEDEEDQDEHRSRLWMGRQLVDKDAQSRKVAGTINTRI